VDLLEIMFSAVNLLEQMGVSWSGPHE
jgi:hypothetical protein